MAELIEFAMHGLAESADRNNGRLCRITAGIIAGLTIIGISIWAVARMI